MSKKEFREAAVKLVVAEGGVAAVKFMALILGRLAVRSDAGFGVSDRSEGWHVKVELDNKGGEE